MLSENNNTTTGDPTSGGGKHAKRAKLSKQNYDYDEDNYDDYYDDCDNQFDDEEEDTDDDQDPEALNHLGSDFQAMNEYNFLGSSSAADPSYYNSHTSRYNVDLERAITANVVAQYADSTTTAPTTKKAAANSKHATAASKSQYSSSKNETKSATDPSKTSPPPLKLKTEPTEFPLKAAAKLLVNKNEKTASSSGKRKHEAISGPSDPAKCLKTKAGKEHGVAAAKSLKCDKSKNAATKKTSSSTNLLIATEHLSSNGKVAEAGKKGGAKKKTSAAVIKVDDMQLQAHLTTAQPLAYNLEFNATNVASHPFDSSASSSSSSSLSSLSNETHLGSYYTQYTPQSQFSQHSLR